MDEYIQCTALYLIYLARICTMSMMGCNFESYVGEIWQQTSIHSSLVLIRKIFTSVRLQEEENKSAPD